MKNLFVALALVLGLASCGNKAEEAATQEVEAVDSTAVESDSTVVEVSEEAAVVAE